MTENKFRLVIVVIAFVSCLIAATILSIYQPDSPLIENLKGAIYVLIPAVMDTARVAKRERDSFRPPKNGQTG